MTFLLNSYHFSAPVASYRDQVLAHAGLVEVYPFNQTISTPSPAGFYGLKNGVNATYRLGRSGSMDVDTGITLVQGESGALVSSDTTHYVVSDSNAPWNNDHAGMWAMECWFQANYSAAAYRPVMQLDDGETGGGRLLYASASNSPIGNGKAWIWSSDVNLQGVTNFCDGFIHHLVLKRRANLDVLFYVDGVLDVQATNPGTTTGNDGFVLLKGFTNVCRMAWVAYYGNAAELTEAQIISHYQAGIAV